MFFLGAILNQRSDFVSFINPENIQVHPYKEFEVIW